MYKKLLNTCTRSGWILIAKCLSSLFSGFAGELGYNSIGGVPLSLQRATCICPLMNDRYGVLGFPSPWETRKSIRKTLQGSTSILLTGDVAGTLSPEKQNSPLKFKIGGHGGTRTPGALLRTEENQVESL